MTIKEFLERRRKANAQADTETISADNTIIVKTDTEDDEDNLVLVPAFVVEDEFSKYF